jgi:hypothetical protein
MQLPPVPYIENVGAGQAPCRAQTDRAFESTRAATELATNVGHISEPTISRHSSNFTAPVCWIW